jgi:hypothetical protein
LLDAIHPREIQHHPAAERNGLPVIACSGAASGDRQVVRVTIAEHVLNFFGAQGLDDDIAHLAIELLAQNR